MRLMRLAPSLPPCFAMLQGGKAISSPWTLKGGLQESAILTNLGNFNESCPCQHRNWQKSQSPHWLHGTDRKTKLENRWANWGTFRYMRHVLSKLFCIKWTWHTMHIITSTCHCACSILYTSTYNIFIERYNMWISNMGALIMRRNTLLDWHYIYLLFSSIHMMPTVPVLKALETLTSPITILTSWIMKLVSNHSWNVFLLNHASKLVPKKTFNFHLDRYIFQGALRAATPQAPQEPQVLRAFNLASHVGFDG